MSTSSIYHTFNVLGPNYYEYLLKFDLVGIGVMIFSFAIALIYTGFHNFQQYGLALVLIMFIFMTINLAMQFTPCYMH